VLFLASCVFGVRAMFDFFPATALTAPVSRGGPVRFHLKLHALMGLKGFANSYHFANS